MLQLGDVDLAIMAKCLHTLGLHGALTDPVLTNCIKLTWELSLTHWFLLPQEQPVSFPLSSQPGEF